MQGWTDCGSEGEVREIVCLRDCARSSKPNLKGTLMSKRATINPSKGLYIKLGRSGKWEKECLESGILRLGFKETPFGAAVSGDWETVRKVWLDARQDEGTATR